VGNCILEAVAVIEENSVNWSLITAVATVIVSIVALTVSIITARVQIVLQKQEWRPYLSHVKTELLQDPNQSKDKLFVEIKFLLKNVGKSILRYEFTRLEIANGAEVEMKCCLQHDEFDGNILYPGSEITHKSAALHTIDKGELMEIARDTCLQEEFEEFRGSLEITDLVGQGLSKLIEFKVHLTIKYWKIDKPNKKYEINHEMVVYLDEHKEVNYLYNIGNAT